MDFNLINFISENWLNAIGTTLFHSLWIGVLLSLVTALVMLATRKLSSSLRYQLLTGCLCLFVVAIGYVFYQELAKNSIGQNQVLAVNQQLSGAANDHIKVLDQTQISSPLTSLMGFWNNYSSQIVLIWFLIICAKSIHLVLGLNTVFYLKRTQVFKTGKIWEDRLATLAKQFGISQKVSIVQTGIAKVPMVIGHFKPIILIPLGLINGLALAEVEAILAHELAHIKRRDYLVNLLQSFIEVVFFFNPAVLWVSKLIKTERENCCDDLALTCVTDKKNYIKALLSCQEFQQNTPDYAMAFTGKNGQLLNRVSRMLYHNKSALNKMEKTVLTLAMVLVFICSAAFNTVQSKQINPGKKQSEVKSATTAKNVVKNTTVKTKAHFWQNLPVKQLAAEDSAYAAAERKYAAAEILRQQHAKMYDLEALKYKTAQDQHDRDAKRYQLDSIKYEAEAKKQEGIARPIQPSTPTTNVTVPISLAIPIKVKTPVKEPDLLETIVSKITSTKTITATDIDDDRYDLTDAINKDLLKDGIINKTAKLSYKIDKYGLYVNGIKQSSTLHKKYKSKYLKKDKSALVYNFELN